MRERKYREITIPVHLNSKNIQLEFDKNIKDNEYLSTNTPYNDTNKLVKETLKKLYDYKCAYCESTLKNSYGEIEHYRPKRSSKLSKCDATKGYYWLAFSWDNLLPCCKMCNNKKLNCFDISDKRVEYSDETLEVLHQSLQSYNAKENPKLLHPEIDEFEKLITFNRKGFMDSNNEKVIYTSQICDLNRENLKEAREKIFTKYQNLIKKNLAVMIELAEESEDIFSLSKFFKINIIDEISKNLLRDEEYSLVSYYIYHHFDTFLKEINLSSEDRAISSQLWLRYAL